MRSFIIAFLVLAILSVAYTKRQEWGDEKKDGNTIIRRSGFSDSRGSRNGQPIGEDDGADQGGEGDSGFGSFGSFGRGKGKGGFGGFGDFDKHFEDLRNRFGSGGKSSFGGRSSGKMSWGDDEEGEGEGHGEDEGEAPQAEEPAAPADPAASATPATPVEPGAKQGPVKGTRAEGDAMAEEVIAAHQIYRDEFNCPRLKWNSKLAESALAWAQKLAQMNTLQHSKNRKGTGENLAMSGGYANTNKGYIDQWGNEKKDFIPGRKFGQESKGGVTGHYTQMIWRKTTEVGCGRATVGSSTYFCCQYAPAGNWVGEKIY